jgi:L-fucose mutarotase
MLKTNLVHPLILAQLARMGHGSQILIADGNFPVETMSPQSAVKVHLNLAPGSTDVMTVLRALTSAVPLESAILMSPAEDKAPPIHEEFIQWLPKGIKIDVKRKPEFYAQVRSSDTGLVIATGDLRRFANIILCMGIITLDSMNG